MINAGAWSHYAWAIRDALEIAGLPAVEVHLSDIKAREPWRHLSVVEEVCIASFAGYGPEGYRLALERLRAELDRPGGTAAGGEALQPPAAARSSPRRRDSGAELVTGAPAGTLEVARVERLASSPAGARAASCCWSRRL